jgi:hypothetical protein
MKEIKTTEKEENIHTETKKERKKERKIEMQRIKKKKTEGTPQRKLVK